MILDRPLIHAGRLLTEELPPLVWDVEPLISRGDRVVVFGEFGSFKSWILLHLAWHLSTGVQWLETFKVTEPRRVLYVDEEMNERTLRRRAKRLAMGAGIDRGNPPLAFLSRAGVRFDAYGAGQLLSYLDTQKYVPAVIIVEALRRVLIGDENEAKDLAAFWRNLEPISRQGITLIITHHMSKPPADGKRALRHRASGSTDILAGSDASFAIEKLKDSRARITGIKARDDVELQPFTVELSDKGDRQGPVYLTPVRPAEREESRPLTPGETEDVLRRPVATPRLPLAAPRAFEPQRHAGAGDAGHGVASQSGQVAIPSPCLHTPPARHASSMQTTISPEPPHRLHPESVMASSWSASVNPRPPCSAARSDAASNIRITTVSPLSGSSRISSATISCAATSGSLIFHGVSRPSAATFSVRTPTLTTRRPSRTSTSSGCPLAITPLPTRPAAGLDTMAASAPRPGCTR